MCLQLTIFIFNRIKPFYKTCLVVCYCKFSIFYNAEYMGTLELREEFRCMDLILSQSQNSAWLKDHVLLSKIYVVPKNTERRQLLLKQPIFNSSCQPYNERKTVHIFSSRMVVEVFVCSVFGEMLFTEERK